MKRLTSLVLALLLALTMMVGAFAETADVTGEWYGELLGIQVDVPDFLRKMQFSRNRFRLPRV